MVQTPKTWMQLQDSTAADNLSMSSTQNQAKQALDTLGKMFSNNKASYGPNIAGVPSQLDLISEEEYNQLMMLNNDLNATNSSHNNGRKRVLI